MKYDDNSRTSRAKYFIKISNCLFSIFPSKMNNFLEFFNVISHATTGKMIDYQLLCHSIIKYPFVIYTNDPSDSVVVHILAMKGRML